MIEIRRNYELFLTWKGGRPEIEKRVIRCYHTAFLNKAKTKLIQNKEEIKNNNNFRIRKMQSGKLNKNLMNLHDCAITTVKRCCN